MNGQFSLVQFISFLSFSTHLNRLTFFIKSFVVWRTTQTTTDAGTEATSSAIIGDRPVPGQRPPTITTNGGHQVGAAEQRQVEVGRRRGGDEGRGQSVERGSSRRWWSSTRRWSPTTARRTSSTTFSCSWTSSVLTLYAVPRSCVIRWNKVK